MDTQETYIDKTPSGLEFEIKRLMGYHQKWLTTSKSKKEIGKKSNAGEKGLEDVLMDVLVSLGGHTFGEDPKADRDVMNRLFSWDLKYMTLVTRFFSTDIHFAARRAAYDKHLEEVAEIEEYNKENKDAPEEIPEFVDPYPPHIFKFNYEYTPDGSDHKVSHKYEVNINLWDFPVTKPAFQIESVDELGKEQRQTLILPISKHKVVWTPLNIALENAHKGAKSVNANTPIAWRNPLKMVPTGKENEELGILIDTDKLTLLDVEALRESIYNMEGRIDTRVFVAHPENDSEFAVDAVAMISFFFPSGVA